MGLGKNWAFFSWLKWEHHHYGGGNEDLCSDFTHFYLTVLRLMSCLEWKIEEKRRDVHALCTSSNFCSKSVYKPGDKLYPQILQTSTQRHSWDAVWGLCYATGSHPAEKWLKFQQNRHFKRQTCNIPLPVVLLIENTPIYPACSSAPVHRLQHCSFYLLLLLQNKQPAHASKATLQAHLNRGVVTPVPQTNCDARKRKS